MGISACGRFREKKNVQCEDSLHPFEFARIMCFGIYRTSAPSSWPKGNKLCRPLTPEGTKQRNDDDDIKLAMEKDSGALSLSIYWGK